MPRIAHRRRGSKFGHHPFAFALVTSPLLPLVLSTSSLRYSFVLTLPLRFTFARTSDSSQTSTGTGGETVVSRRRLLPSLHHPAPSTMLSPGPLLCL